MIAVDRCKTILHTLFNGVEEKVQSGRNNSEKLSFFYKNNRLLEVEVINEDKNIFKYTADFRLAAQLLNRSSARIHRDKIITIQKYQYNLGNLLTAKYLSLGSNELDYSAYSSINETISISLDLSKVTGAFISKESFAYVDDDGAVDHSSYAILNLIIDNKIYPISINPVVLDDSILCASIAESILNNNLKDDMMVSY